MPLKIISGFYNPIDELFPIVTILSPPKIDLPITNDA